MVPNGSLNTLNRSAADYYYENTTLVSRLVYAVAGGGTIDIGLWWQRHLCDPGQELAVK
jgi:hypothetical protein